MNNFEAEFNYQQLEKSLENSTSLVRWEKARGELKRKSTEQESEKKKFFFPFYIVILDFMMRKHAALFGLHVAVLVEVFNFPV